MYLIRLHSRIRRQGQNLVMEDEFILFPLKCHRFLASRRRGWRCSSHCTVWMCERECESVFVFGTGKREKEGHVEEESGKTERVSKDGASWCSPED